MITNILFFLWVGFILLLLSMIVRKMLCRSFIYPFKDYDKTDVPYITVDIQGHELNFLVDTGCGVSVISKYVLERLSYQSSNRTVNLVALTPDSLNSNMVTIPLTVNGKRIEEDFVLYDNPDFGNFKQLYGIELHGILGNEFLEKTGCQIDYKNHVVVVQ